MDYGTMIKFFVSLLVVCNPLSALPAFLSLTRGKDLTHKKDTALRTSLACFLIFLVSLWIGKPLLAFFEIRIAAFQVAGGFVLFALAYALMQATPSALKEEPESAGSHRSSQAIVPLAMPIIAGPGAISTAIVFSALYPSTASRAMLSLSAASVAVVILLSLLFAARIERLLGNTGVNILGRIGGLILAAIAVETMAKGVLGLFPSLGASSL